MSTTSSDNLLIKGPRAENFAILRSVWYLSEEKRMLLTTHKLLRSTDHTLLQYIYEDDNDHFKDKMDIGSITFELVYMNCSGTSIVEEREEGKDKEFLISLRVVGDIFAVAIIQPRFPTMSKEWYLSISELEELSVEDREVVVVVVEKE